MSTEIKLITAFLLVALSACSNPVSVVTTEQIASVTPFAIPPTWTPSPILPSKPTPTVFPTFTITPVRAFPKRAPRSHEVPTQPQNWYVIPEITTSDPANPINTSLFEGIKIPPLPDDVTEEFSYSSPYGEVPSRTISYEIYMMRHGNARMLWLGVPLAEGTESQIYDAIPLPPTQAGEVLIPFTCVHDNEEAYDYFLVVLAAYPGVGQPATDIHYSWRIDPETTSLQPVSYQDIVCPPYW